MDASRSLTVLMPTVPGQRWSCQSCGDCCRTLVGHLFEHEVRRIKEQEWEEELGISPCVQTPRGWVLNKHADGACVFLDGNNLCRIHARFGEGAKPLACRIFPFSVRPIDGGWQASLRFDCPSVASSVGDPIRRYGDVLRELCGELQKPTQSASSVRLCGRWEATAEELDGIELRIGRLMMSSEVSFAERITVLARLTQVFSEADLRRVRGERLFEFIDLMIGGLQTEVVHTRPQPPTQRQVGMLRQFAFACSEHVSLDELRGGIGKKLRIRWRQLRAGRRFRRGVGKIPPLRGMLGTTTFDEVELVSPAKKDQDRIDELLTRYVAARIGGKSLFGEGYYGWSVAYGMAALCLAIAAARWVARFVAATNGRKQLTFDDVAKGLGVIDRAVTRVPVLGSLSERARVAHLLRDDGLARLAWGFRAVAGE